MSNINVTRLKMQVFTVKPSGTSPENPGTESVQMHAVCGGTKNPEDNAFAKYTPSASLQLNVDNPAVHGFFKPGRKYYVDVHECPEEAQA